MCVFLEPNCIWKFVLVDIFPGGSGSVDSEGGRMVLEYFGLPLMACNLHKHLEV